MAGEMMDLDELAAYLNRDKRELDRLAGRGNLPGRKVAGAWRFSRAEVNHWLESQLAGYSEQELSALEAHKESHALSEPLVAGLLSEQSIEVPLAASTRASVLKKLVTLAEQSGYVYDPDSILEAIRQREDIASTGLDSGVAIPHPKRPLPAALGEHIIAYGRTGAGIPFSAPNGKLTDIFFLVCCRDESSHLKVLARLARLILRPDFVDNLRQAEDAKETWKVIETAERDLSDG